MSARFQGKVAFITGAARGQGRAHAVRLASEGADIIAVDVCAPIGTVGYDLATQADLAQTAKDVEALDRRIVTARADVRDQDSLAAALADGVAELGRLDVVVANAGILSSSDNASMQEQMWRDMIDVNLTGVFHTVQASIPHLLHGGPGGAVVLTSSALGIRAMPNVSHYSAAKAGVIGLMKSLALELAPHQIRVNTVNPTIVDTAMVQNEATYALFMPGVPNPDRAKAREAYATLQLLPTPWVEVADVANAVAFLASDEARYITGLEMKIDAGFCLG